MRILQVVTYISPDGAYGGPMRVAINQAKALTEQGHEVIVAAAAGGFDGSLPEQFDGFPVHLFPCRRVVPKSGFAGITSPGLLAWLPQAIQGADVVHVHLARDFVTLPSAALALLSSKPMVVQTHGMIDETKKWLARPLDTLLTKPILRAASKVLHLTRREKLDLEAVGGPTLAFSQLANAVQVPEAPAVEQMHGISATPEVLYLARLHARKKPEFVVHAAKSLTTRWPDARFTLVGPDEGAGQTVLEEIKNSHIEKVVTWSGSLPPNETVERMRRASIYVLPSIDEPFPMSVLEAMSLGLPVVVTNTCGLAPLIEASGAGIVCKGLQSSFNEALDLLLGDNSLRVEMGARGRSVIEQDYTLARMSEQLTHIYEQSAR